MAYRSPGSFEPPPKFVSPCISTSFSTKDSDRGVRGPASSTSEMERLSRPLGFVLFLWSAIYFAAVCSKPQPRAADWESVQNTTLRFGAIYVATESDSSWRVRGLQQAAEFVGLSLTIPALRHLSDAEVQEHFEEPKANGPGELDLMRGSLNEIRILENFLDSEFETALILREDVDFGVDVQAQMAAVSRAIMFSMPQERLEFHFDGHDYKSIDYSYGKHQWDILLLGHSGVEPSEQTIVAPYSDPIAMPWSQVVAPGNDYYATLRAHDTRYQQILRDVAGITVSAYAITRYHAPRLISRLKHNPIQPVDASLYYSCKGRESLCAAPVPEVMARHYVDGSDKWQNTGEQDLAWWRKQHKYTPNVRYSARCNAAKIGTKVDDRLQCLPSDTDPV